jgi:hypothetical protein
MVCSTGPAMYYWSCPGACKVWYHQTCWTIGMLDHQTYWRSTADISSMHNWDMLNTRRDVVCVWPGARRAWQIHPHPDRSSHTRSVARYSTVNDLLLLSNMPYSRPKIGLVDRACVWELAQVHSRMLHIMDSWVNHAWVSLGYVDKRVVSTPSHQRIDRHSTGETCWESSIERDVTLPSRHLTRESMSWPCWYLSPAWSSTPFPCMSPAAIGRPGMPCHLSSSRTVLQSTLCSSIQSMSSTSYLLLFDKKTYINIMKIPITPSLCNNALP